MAHMVKLDPSNLRQVLGPSDSTQGMPMLPARVAIRRVERMGAEASCQRIPEAGYMNSVLILSIQRLWQGEVN